MINKKSFSEQIYEDLKKNIFEQKIRFGEKLVNRNLQRQYGVSSTPVRDAINRLHQDGLLQSISKGGARVINFDYTYAFEINEIIAMMNCNAVALSVKNENIDIIVKKLEIIIKKQEKYINTDRYFNYDQQFHLIFFEYSENQCFIKLYAQYESLWQLLFHFYYRDKNTKLEYSITAHRKILDLYRNKKIEYAIQETKLHFEQVIQPLKRFYCAI